ncbi:MAG: glycosyltransferase [Bacteriovoracaceae bacterium]
MNSPFFSVITPAYNRAYTLERAIESVQIQKFKDWELIVIDDGSTDDTAKVLEAHAGPAKIKIVKTDNHGVSMARNIGARKAQGEWLAFLDSDDEWLPQKLQRQFDFIQNFPDIKLVHTEEIWIRNGVRVNPKKKYKKGGGDQFLPSLKLCAISPSATAIRKDVFSVLGGFREDFPVCEDYDLWLKFTSLYPTGFIEDALLKKFGGHCDQLSGKYKAMDYWRCLSLAWILKNRELSQEKRKAALDVLSEKLSILAHGYKKRENFEGLKKIEEIKESAF